MKTLERQLADYGNRQRELHGPISPDELIARLERSHQLAPIRPPRRRGLWVAVAAAAVTLLVFGLGPLFFSDGDAPVADTVVPTTIRESTPTTLGEPAPTTPTWSRISLDDGVGGLGSVTVGGPGLVAVGVDDVSPGGDGDAAVWTSPDGIIWSRVPPDEAVFGGAGIQYMSSVTVGGPGLVAVGWGRLGDDEDAAVWTSPDGISWSRVPHDEAVFGGDGDKVMTSVTAGGPGLVAVGRDTKRVDGLFGDGDAAVWTSPDGISWSRVPHDEAVFGGDGYQEMLSVTAGGPGLVAVGWEAKRAGVAAAVWTSPDGIIWSRVPHDEAVFGGDGDEVMWSVTAGGPGLVAVGVDAPGGDGDAAVWTSPDGIIWSRIPHDEAVFGGDSYQIMRGVTAGGPGLVAVGVDGFGINSDAAVWTSPDGIIWSRVPHEEAAFGAMLSVTFGGPGLVAVGNNAVVWVAATD